MRESTIDFSCLCWRLIKLLQIPNVLHLAEFRVCKVALVQLKKIHFCGTWNDGKNKLRTWKYFLDVYSARKVPKSLSLSKSQNITVWKFQDFSVTQILREINFGNYWSFESTNYCIFKALNFIFWYISALKDCIN